jgi:hypothetical protein
MNKSNIEKAVRAAEDFITAVADMRVEEKSRVSEDGKYQYDSPKHRGSVRRKSMDLSRALSEMRKP